MSPCIKICFIVITGDNIDIPSASYAWSVTSRRLDLLKDQFASGTRILDIISVNLISDIIHSNKLT